MANGQCNFFSYPQIKRPEILLYLPCGQQAQQRQFSFEPYRADCGLCVGCSFLLS